MKKYTIQKNSHTSKLFGFLPHFGFTFKNEICISAKLHDNCLYDFDTIDKYDANKLYGVSTSWSHMIDSARIGWRCVDGKLQILAFVHDDKKILEAEVLGEVLPNEWFDCKIKIHDHSYTFIFKNVVKYFPKTNKSWKFKYKLFPYFGGNMKAPHKMNIDMK